MRGSPSVYTSIPDYKAGGEIHHWVFCAYGVHSNCNTILDALLFTLFPQDIKFPTGTVLKKASNVPRRYVCAQTFTVRQIGRNSLVRSRTRVIWIKELTMIYRFIEDFVEQILEGKNLENHFPVLYEYVNN